MKGKVAVMLILFILSGFIVVTREPAQAEVGIPIGNVIADTGWATFGQVVPKGKARDRLLVGELKTQTDVKTRWEDGSIRFAVVSAFIPESGQYSITSAPLLDEGEMFFPSFMNAQAVLTTATDTWIADGSNLLDEPWLSGGLVAEFRTPITPVNAQGQEHPFLRVIFDSRSYNDNDGSVKLDVIVENTLDVEGATSAAYTIDVIVDGENIYHHDELIHYYLTRFRKSFPLYGLQLANITPDLAPFIQANAIPEYLDVVSNDVISPEGSNFDILQAGLLATYMPMSGGRAEIAPYPDWTARYLVHQDPEQKRLVLAQGDLAGSWPMHIRETDGRLISIDEHPNFWLDDRADADGHPKGDLSALGPLRPDIAHQPSLAYIPYLLTGDHYLAEEMKFWANYDLIGTFQDHFYNGRDGSRGLLAPNETRGFSWALRNMSDAAAYLPDDDPLKSYFIEKVMNNLAWADAYVDSNVNPLGTSFELKRYHYDDPYAWVAIWEHAYLAWAIDHANEQGFVGGAKLLDRIVAFHMRLFTIGAAYPREYVGPYELAVALKGENDVLDYFEDICEVFDLTFDKGQAAPPQLTGYYGPEARLMTMIAMKLGMSESIDSYGYVTYKITDSPDSFQNDLAVRAGYSIAPPFPVPVYIPSESEPYEKVGCAIHSQEQDKQQSRRPSVVAPQGSNPPSDDESSDDMSTTPSDAEKEGQGIDVQELTDDDSEEEKVPSDAQNPLLDKLRSRRNGLNLR